MPVAWRGSFGLGAAVHGLVTRVRTGSRDARAPALELKALDLGVDGMGSACAGLLVPLRGGATWVPLASELKPYPRQARSALHLGGPRGS